MSRGAVARIPRAEQWADRICAQLGKSVESIIEVGRLLIDAKSELVHGEWTRMFTDDLVPFNRHTAFKLIAIANNPQLSNVSHGKRLPPSWTTLYELSRVPEPTLKHAITDGLITPDMPRKAIKALLPVKPAIQPEVVAPVVIEDESDFEMPHWADDEIRTRVDAALQPIRELIEAWPDDQSFAVLTHQLQQILRYVERLSNRHEISA